MKLQELNEEVHLTGFLQTKKEISEWLDDFGVGNYNINEDLSIDVNGMVDLEHKLTQMIYIPVQFNKIRGGFWCADNYLSSLVGCPREVDGGFYCNENNLSTLRGAPETVGGEFNCSYNRLKTLEGGPRHVGKEYNCHRNMIMSLEGGPQKTGGDFQCFENDLSSLHNIHRYVKHIGGHLIIDNNINSHILGLMRIKKLRFAQVIDSSNKTLNKALDIININLLGRGNIHTAQEQLLDAGLQEYAQL